MPKVTVGISEGQGKIIREVIKSQEKKILHVAKQLKGLNTSQFYHFLNGIKRIRTEFVNDLYVILHRDERLKFLENLYKANEPDYFSSDFTDKWRNIYDTYSLKLRDVVINSSNKTRIQLIQDLEALIDKYRSG